MSKYSIEKAQQTLNERNNHFILLEYNGMRNHSVVKCKECGDVFSVSLDSLLRNKSKNFYGCKNCNNIATTSKYKSILLNNQLTLIKNNNETLYVKCNICNHYYTRRRVNLLKPNFLCPYCSEKTKNDKILNNPNLYKEATLHTARIHKNLQSLYNSKSLKWFYLLGLMMSDGSFNPNSHRMRLFLNQKDKNVISYITALLGCEIKEQNNQTCGIDIAGQVIDEIIKEYNIHNQKTYYPCDISSIKGENLLAFIVGFIDGDGNIGCRSSNKKLYICIKLHKSWKNNLDYISKNLYQYFGIKNYPKPVYIKKNEEIKYAAIYIRNQTVIKELYTFLNNYSLSVMDRKWGKIKEVIKK